jgi:hypothetical protein
MHLFHACGEIGPEQLSAVEAPRTKTRQDTEKGNLAAR